MPMQTTTINCYPGKLPAAIANAIGIDPIITVGAIVSGGVIDKMISPQSIAVAAAAGSLVGKESELFRFTVKHRFLMLIFICFIVLGHAYQFNWVIPRYQQIIPVAAALAEYPKGYACLLGLLILILLLGGNHFYIE
ncbi:MAG: L-lactate permease [Bacteroidota bacterium]